MVTDTSLIVCTTAAGEAKAQVGFGVLRGLADTTGTPLSSLHQVAAQMNFSETVTVTGAASGTFRATILLTGQVSVGSGVTNTAGFIKSDWAGAQLIEATGDATVLSASNTQVNWSFDENSAGTFAESMTVEWSFTSGAPLILGSTLSVSALLGGLVLDFFNTVVVDGFEGFDGDGNPIELEIRGPGDELLATAVPEPAIAGLLGLAALAGLAVARRRRP